MEIVQRHPWDVTPEQARDIQNGLRQRVLTTPCPGPLRTVVGVDVGVRGGVARAAVVVLSYPELATMERAVIDMPVTFPYVPGLLAFRECPAVLRAFEKLHLDPDLIIVDGQGLAHPRRFGIACHLGVLLDRPTIGCAKSRLIGTFEAPALPAGSWAPLWDAGETIGAVLRTRDGASPLFVSIGHKVDLETAIRLVLSCCRGRRLPETTRLAHQAASGA
jgi:deoxyribonuclease V